MKLVELAFPPRPRGETRERARALCEALEKTPVEVPDIPGFVVNRLLFPYLFYAVELQAETGMAAEDIDRCMTLGAGTADGPARAARPRRARRRRSRSARRSALPVPGRLSELVARGLARPQVQAGLLQLRLTLTFKRTL